MSKVERNFFTTNITSQKVRGGEIIESSSGYVFIIDGANIKVPRKIGRLIKFFLTLQKKFDEDVGFLLDKSVYFSGINCHKTALYLRGEITKEHLLDIERDEDGAQSGHLDVEMIDVLGKKSDRINTFSNLENKLKDFDLPVSLHAYRKLENNNFVASHSMIILGESDGKIYGFHKTGPGVDMPFELTCLDEIIKNYEQQSKGVMHDDDIMLGRKSEYFFRLEKIEK